MKPLDTIRDNLPLIGGFFTSIGVIFGAGIKLAENVSLQRETLKLTQELKKSDSLQTEALTEIINFQQKSSSEIVNLTTKTESLNTAMTRHLENEKKLQELIDFQQNLLTERKKTDTVTVKTKIAKIR